MKRPWNRHEEAETLILQKKRLVASLVVGSIGAIIGGFGGLVWGSFEFFKVGWRASLPAGIVSGFLACFWGSAWYLPLMEQKNLLGRFLFGALFGGLAGASSGAITGIILGLFELEDPSVVKTALPLGALLGGIVGVIVSPILTAVGSRFFPKTFQRDE